MSDGEMYGGGDLRTSWSRGVAFAVLAGILILGFGLRIYRLGDECIWLDEVVSYPYLDLPTLGAYLEEVRSHDPPMSPLYFTLQYYWARVVGDSVTAVRSLSIVFGLASIVLVYVLGVVLYNRSAGLVAALCTAMAIPHVYYAQEVRVYALLQCLALGSMLTLALALRRGGRRWWIAHAACNALILTTHLFGVLLIVAQGCYLIAVHGRRWRMWLGWGCAHAAMLAPFLIRVNRLRGDALDQAISFIPEPSLRWLLNTYCVYYPGVDAWGGRLHAIGPVVGVLALLAVMGTAAIVADRRNPGNTLLRTDTFVLLTLWYLLPPFLLFVLSYAVTPSFVERYTLYSSFALYLMAGGALALPNRSWWTGLVLVGIGCHCARGHVSSGRTHRRLEGSTGAASKPAHGHAR
ncbi:MAG: glycosyltransferase family 39 protein [Candidatus Hydrogenedentes bacterium]|nr:glycosyltransferase family 39 protein [Candidatus Hydrogenedentota bacterium]